MINTIDKGEMSSHKSKDAKKVRDFNITTHTKGFKSTTTIDGNPAEEYFQFKDIYQIIHHPNIGVEIVGTNTNRRVFYNDETGKSQELYDMINSTMLSWMSSNLN